MAVTLPQGTKEYIVVNVDDELDNLLTLDGTTPQYRILTEAGVEKLTWTNAVIQVMKLFCMVDTQSGGLWAAGEYRLYARFTTAPELPWLGPFPFTVDNS